MLQEQLSRKILIFLFLKKVQLINFIAGLSVFMNKEILKQNLFLFIKKYLFKKKHYLK